MSAPSSSPNAEDLAALPPRVIFLQRCNARRSIINEQMALATASRVAGLHCTKALTATVSKYYKPTVPQAAATQVIAELQGARPCGVCQLHPE